MFIRYYFLKLCKDRLPDTGSEYEGVGGNIDDAIEIILKVFVNDIHLEMLKLYNPLNMFMKLHLYNLL